MSFLFLFFRACQFSSRKQTVLRYKGEDIEVKSPLDSKLSIDTKLLLSHWMIKSLSWKSRRLVPMWGLRLCSLVYKEKSWVAQELRGRGHVGNRAICPGGNKCKGEIGAFSLCSVAVNWPVQFVQDIQDSLTTQFQHPSRLDRGFSINRC